MPIIEQSAGLDHLEAAQRPTDLSAERGADRWKSWQWGAIITSGAAAGLLVSLGIAQAIWPEPAQAGIQSLVIGLGAAVGGFLIPNVAYNRMYTHTWFGKS